jgi:hypothetical protein
MGHPNICSHTLNLVILTNGKDLLFAYAGNKARVAHSRAAFGPWVGKNPAPAFFFPTHDDGAVMSGPPRQWGRSSISHTCG